jgi:hypothetical protein
MSKYGLRFLGLVSMVAVGLMAFGASAALAVSLELGDKFYSGEAAIGLINSGTEFPTGLTTQEAKGTQIGSARFLIPAKSVEIVCAKGELTSAVAGNEYENFITGTMNKGGYGKGTARAKECKVQEINPTTGVLTGKELVNCVPNSATTPGEVTAQGLGFVKRHEGLAYGVLVPQVTSKAQAEANEALTSAFTTITFGELCALPSPVKITGSVGEAAPAADAIKPKRAADTFSAAGKAIQALLGTKLKFGANEAYVQGEGEAELVGKNVPWGAM